LNVFCGLEFLRPEYAWRESQASFILYVVSYLLYKLGSFYRVGMLPQMIDGLRNAFQGYWLVHNVVPPIGLKILCALLRAWKHIPARQDIPAAVPVA
jgi:hypothetical protein